MSEQLMRNADDALARDQVGQAIEYLKESVNKTPDRVAARIRLANVLAAQGQRLEAIEQLLIAVEKNRSQPELHIRLAQLYLESGQLIHAAQHATLAIGADQVAPRGWNLRGDIEFARGNYDAALADYHQSIGLTPDQPAIQLKIAKTYRLMGRPYRAISVLETFMRETRDDPVRFEALVMQGELLIQAGQPQRAATVLANAAESTHATPLTYILLCRAQVQSKRFDEARITLQRGQLAFADEPIFLKLMQQMPASDPTPLIAGSVNNDR